MKTPIILLAAMVLGSTAASAQDTSRKMKSPENQSERMRNEQNKNKNRLDSSATYKKQRDMQMNDTLMNRRTPPNGTPLNQTAPPLATPPPIPINPSTPAAPATVPPRK